MKPISKTAFYCCGVRMQDAASAAPVCNDVYAQNFMNEDGWRVFEAFRGETSPNASNVARHRLIDDRLRAALAAHPGLTVITIGAGFDSRPFRLSGGTWVELDEPQIIAYKNERLPAAGSPNPLTRIAIEFATESLEEKLAAYAGQSAVTVVIEGVFIYLDREQINNLLAAVRRLFPEHELICDLMTRAFFEKYSRTLHEKINDIGTAFKIDAERPEKIFLDNGYRLAEKTSIIESAVNFGSIKMPKILLKTLFRDLRDGYAIYVFEA
jgi:methyltransferase (TIGR00027 family)